MPAEWSPHARVWTAWPYDKHLWGDDLAPAQAEVAGLVRALAAGRSGEEAVQLLVRDDRAAADATAVLGSCAQRVVLHTAVYADIWLRDTAAVFVHNDGATAATRFAFNGWGGRYPFAEDRDVAASILTAARTTAAGRFSVQASDLICEGGALESDGEGTLLTSASCLLNPNRNPAWARSSVEEELRRMLGVDAVVWLGEGLRNDHTDGHVDTLARFVAPGTVVCMQAQDADDPNRETLEAIATRLKSARDACGRRLEVLRIPSPGAVCTATGELLPASYLNFYIGNATVAVPIYGSFYDDAAVRALEPCFPNHHVQPLPSRAILTGGGAFHCITRDEPVDLRVGNEDSMADN